MANWYWQNEYAAILAKRVNEEKAKKTELRSKSILHLCGTVWMAADLRLERRASSMRK